MALNKGDMVLFDYSLFVEGKLNETSNRKAAEEAGVVRPNAPYQPILFTVGLGQIVPGLEESIVKTGVGPHLLSSRVRVPMPYGPRGRDLIKTVPKQKFGAQQPQVGMTVTLEGREGIVTKVGGGRVTIDCHHELAGKDVEYEYTVRDIYTEPKPKVQAMLARALGNDVLATWSDDDSLTVQTPTSVLGNPQWAQSRPRFVGNLWHAMGKPIPVTFIETHLPPPPPPVVATPPPETVVPPTEEAVDPTL